MNKNDLIHKIKQLEGISQDERSYLINLVNTKKKYGLVWEDKPEDVEEQLRTQLPVLREVPEKRILGKDLPIEIKTIEAKELNLFSSEGNQENPENHGSDIFPNHILIEGDNLHALTALTFTHEGKIDVMYFDPPYNTGNKDFKYNDNFVDREDSYRHSKWLSFMHKRLRISKLLLSESGVIFISIDDNEQAQLKLLCDEIFGEQNFVSNIIWQKRTSPDSRKILGAAHDNIYVYCKNSSELSLGTLALSEEQEARFKNPDNDPRGLWVSSDFTAQGFRPNQMYKIITPSGSEYYPPEGRCWKNIESVYNKQLKEGRMWFGKDGRGIPRRKTYLKEREGAVPWTWWDNKSSGSNQDAKKEIIDILGKSTAFDTPKPILLLRKILEISTNQTSKVLDIFAGSGTTLHATMQLNFEDGGNRQCILVTNNENNICEDVTYVRNSRVIQGYTNSKGNLVSGLSNNNLRYYISEFIDREPSLKNKRELTRLATELLCIKEDCYTEKALDFVFTNKSDSKNIRFFEENNKRMLVVYDDSAIETSVEIIKSIIANNRVHEDGIKVYVFSPGQYPFTEEFEEVFYYITLCALPDAIYKAFLNVLPKKLRESIPELEEDVVDSQPELFD
jgi:adenine-specific DNA-methyltransferase